MGLPATPRNAPTTPSLLLRWLLYYSVYSCHRRPLLPPHFPKGVQTTSTTSFTEAERGIPVPAKRVPSPDRFVRELISGRGGAAVRAGPPSNCLELLGGHVEAAGAASWGGFPLLAPSRACSAAGVPPAFPTKPAPGSTAPALEAGASPRVDSNHAPLPRQALSLQPAGRAWRSGACPEVERAQVSNPRLNSSAIRERD